MKKFLLVLSLCSAAALWSGCASASKDQAPSFVMFDDGGTSRPVTCTGVQLGKTVDGRMKVTAHLRNNAYRRLEVQVNCVFSDVQGYTVDEVPFRTLILDENATQDVAFEAFHTNAVKYLIRVRTTR